MANALGTNNKLFAGAMVLAVPVLLFLFFYIYTKPTTDDMRLIDLPHKMFPVGIDTIRENSNVTIDSVYHTIPDFSFTNQFGQTITQETLEGKIYVADFFFTSCPTICPKMTGQLARVQEEFMRDEQVVLLSYTVDPARDTVQKLKKYAEEYNAVPGKWQFLTGDKSAIYEHARKGYYLAAADESVEIENDFVHTERMVLVDPDKNIRGYYFGTKEAEVNRMMGDIVLLLMEYKR